MNCAACYRTLARFQRIIALIGLPTMMGAVASAAPPPIETGVPCPPSAARLILWHSGVVTLNGLEAALDKLPSTFAALKPMPMEVCYAQEDG